MESESEYRKRFPIWKLLVILLPQIFLFLLVIFKEELNRYYSTSVFLELVQPKDHRHLFMGDYIVLHYQIGQASVVRNLCSSEFLKKFPTTLYFTLQKKRERNIWEVIRCLLEQPKGNEIFIKGRYQRNGGEDGSIVSFGIEKYFVPEGKGLKLEKYLIDSLRDGKEVKAKVLVGHDGTARLESL